MFFQRLKNLWKLSQFEPGKPTDEYKVPGTQIVTLVKKPEITQKAVFLPRVKRDPVKEIISETENI